MIQFTVRVIPRASKPGIAGTRDGALLIRLQSPPVEGAANAELLELIGLAFDVPKRDIRIISGEHSKLKRVAISTIDRQHVDIALRSLGIDPQELTASSAF